MFFNYKPRNHTPGVKVYTLDAKIHTRGAKVYPLIHKGLQTAQMLKLLKKLFF